MLETPVNGTLIAIPLHHCHLNGEVLLERPCDLKLGFTVTRRFRIGAFSYSFSHISENVAEIGRYCSIAGEVMFGQMEHPTDWLATSGFQYEPGYMDGFMPGMADRRFDAVALPDESKRRPISIGNDVWLGVRSYLKSGIRVGDGAIIGANAVVTKDVPPYAIVVGNPGRIVRFRFAPEIIERLLALRWWRYTFLDLKGLDPRNIETAIAQIERLVADGLQPYLPPLTHLVGNGHDVVHAAIEPGEPDDS